MSGIAQSWKHDGEWERHGSYPQVLWKKPSALWEHKEDLQMECEEGHFNRNAGGEVADCAENCKGSKPSTQKQGLWGRCN